MLILVASSLIAVGLAHRLHPIWFLTPQSHVDPWLYWGTGEDYDYLGAHLGTSYYFRRWTLILPNYLFQHLLSPYTAQLVLRSGLLFGVCFFGGLFAFLMSGALSAGLITTLGLVFPAFIVRSAGFSYNQATGLLLFFALASVLAKWGSDQGTYLVKKGFAAGLLLGLLFVTYPWTGYLWPTLVVLAAFQAGGLSRSVSVIWRVLAGGAAGFATIVLLDWGVGRLLHVPWTNVVSYSLQIGRILTAAAETPSPAVFLTEQVLTKSSFALVGVVVAALMFVGGRSLLPGCRQLAWCLLVLSATYLMDPWTRANANPSMQTIIYLSALLVVSVALLTASIIELAWDRRRSLTVRLMSVGGVCAVGSLLILYLDRLATVKWWLPVAVAALAGIVQAILRSFTERRVVWTIAVLLATGASTAALHLTMETWKASVMGTFVNASEARGFMQRLSKEHRSLMTRAREDGRRIWILDDRPHSGWSPNISAAYGMYSAFALDYPPTPSCSQLTWLLTAPNPTVVVYGLAREADAVAMIASLAKPCLPLRVTPRKNPPEAASWFDIERE